MADNHVRELSAGGNATSFQEEIQMDTNGDGVVDAADNPIPSDTTNTSRVHHLLKKSRWIQTVMVL